MPGQVFTWAKWQWDVDAGLRIVASTPRPPELVAVGQLVNLLVLIRVNGDHVDAVDLDEPILLAPVPGAGGQVLPIDGWHRIAKAHRQGVALVPAYRLTREEGDLIRTERTTARGRGQSPRRR